MRSEEKMHVVIIGSGAAGLSAAWLLSRQHRVTLLERDCRLGGHSHTALVEGREPSLPIDTGFIVYNEPCYPNLTRWFKTLGVATETSEMSFSVSRDSGNFEYAGGPALGLVAQPSLLLRRRYWRMLRDLLRFYRQAARTIPADSDQSLGDYLKQHRYSQEFLDDHLLPFGAAIWSTSRQNMLDYPAAAFIRFCDNHGLLNIHDRPQWRTVSGGSRQYVNAVKSSIHDTDTRNTIEMSVEIDRVERASTEVVIHRVDGSTIEADHVVIATHADQALALLDSPSNEEQALLSPFSYDTNRAVLHTDTRRLPRRRSAWCSWNYVETAEDDPSRVAVSYWMNRLQNLDTKTDYVVTLNPTTEIESTFQIRESVYQHPVFNNQTYRAQQQLWQLQGQQRTWFCGSYFGAGFHEDAVQSGFAVAEKLGGLERPWTLENPSSRIVVTPTNRPTSEDKVGVNGADASVVP